MGKRRLSHFPLVLHGASAVNTVEIQRINAAGGQLNPQAKGVSESELSAAIQLGVSNVNVATDARLLRTRVHREFFRNQPESFDPAEPGRICMQELGQLVVHKCRVLGSAGQLEEVRALNAK